MKRVLFLLIPLVWVLATHTNNKLIVVSVPSYNNVSYYRKNLDSILRQEYSNFYVVYVDDCSTDGTAQAVEAYIKEHQCEDRVLLIKNTERRGAMYNHYMVAHALPNDAIVVTVDGDDWLPDNKNTVLSRINQAYQDPDVWMTYGQFEEYPSGKIGFCRALPEGLKKIPVYRDFTWVTSHPRTYYAGLFKQIPIGYFIRDTNFLQATCDLAIMFALLELSGGRAQFIDEVLYSYNTANSNSDCYTRNLEQIHNDHWVRSRTPLKPLDTCPIGYKSSCEQELHNLHISFDSDACAAYCATLATAGIDPHAVQIVCAPYLDEEKKRYAWIAEEYNIAVKQFDDASDFKACFLSVFDSFAHDTYILLTFDECLWKRAWDPYDAIDVLARTHARCYCCVRGVTEYQDPIFMGSHTQPTMVHLYDDYYVWKPMETQGSWHHPYASPAVLIRASTLRSLVERMRVPIPEMLLFNLSYIAPDNTEDVVLCSNVPPCRYEDLL